MVTTYQTESANLQTLTTQKLTTLRSLMIPYQLDYYLIPAVDEHLNLSVPESKQRRAWISGFTGSAGDLLVSQTNCWLFVDSRYHEQADLQVDLVQIQVAKLGKEGQLTLIETLEKLAQEAKDKQSRFCLGFDPFTLAVELFNTFLQRLTPLGVELIPLPENLVDQVRAQSPWNTSEEVSSLAQSPIFQLPLELTGETASQKLARVREAMQKSQIDILPLTNLNQIAWLFNLRGYDIPFIPLFIAYAVVTQTQAFLFTNLERIAPEIKQNLSGDVTLLTYAQYPELLQSLLTQTSQCRVLLDPKHTTTGTYQAVLSQKDESIRQVEIVFAANPIEPLKARKNPVEIEQMKTANFKASRAKTLTLKWLIEGLKEGKELTEFDVKTTIEQYYQQEAGFHCLAFRTIAGAGANSSIIHYGTPSPEVLLKSGEFLLLDSGVQYLGGTTDDTRTFIIGEPTPLQIDRYTTVLIAHINCAMQRFPKGTTGAQLDAITRSVLWQEQLDFGHGTGHGVGAFLSGHEGPNGISRLVQYPLEPGMITSIEPGYYQSGWGGIRLENLYVVTELPSNNETIWYGFEPLTFIPFDRRLIDLNRLSQSQKTWLQAYHAKVVAKLTPTLDPDTANWLTEITYLGS